MSKTLVRPFALTALTLLSAAAWGAVERETFELYVTIPTADFHVVPLDPQLVQREQRLPFSTITGELSPLRATYEVKNSNGSIGARLGQEAYLSNGRDRIDLRVRFNGVELTLDSAQVVSATEARPGRQVPLEIAAIKPDDDYKPGDYYGTVHMVFDATAP
ncbi:MULTISPECIES: CS1 type fimbrial major subunit [unclassified Pseudomonas]|uniref:CS1 type fimbrial major subunit n=1 Tax=unclassified Pseudomonas TaxID=196821 RepID=UPI00119A7F35|nr:MULTISPECIES: CS1 type fimbrial major subunit [unclassified Pseudomonas]TWC20393.1 CS1 type fimbrial major subunit [Pseudomonas sp. SJZ075]TWC25728.1 CS1 type fimbrial major subunit [Pseudomonas sp. SJZ074]TWC35823.1 CS1 type fimbrial major subunit [Pseudomonas sp. SJZ078]TWC42539.1 CS1 type fimbrial major subunit [Pseudomonas sp. SJZ085]TWC56691.1 CS1 type fimbrial major subunit [Pseudomonas sp. SJZ124]